MTRMTDTERMYVSEDDPIIGLIRDHKRCLAEIERLKAALMWIWDQGDGDVSRVVAREALEGKDE